MEIIFGWLLIKAVSKNQEINFREEKNFVQILENFVNKFNVFKKLYIFIFVKKLNIFNFYKNAFKNIDLLIL